MIPLSWTWRDLARAFKAARWAFYHADDLTMLKHQLSEESQPHWVPERKRWARVNQWLANRFLGSLPIE